MQNDPRFIELSESLRVAEQQELIARSQVSKVLDQIRVFAKEFKEKDRGNQPH